MKLSELTPDARNARKHSARNLGMIEDSISEVGASRSIVIDENGRILAGNGTVLSAERAGIENVIVIPSDGKTLIAVQRTGLTEAQKTRLGLLDNRAAELGEWNSEILQELAAEVDITDLWDEEEMTALFAELNAEQDTENYNEGVTDFKNVFQVLIDCATESEQTTMLTRFIEQGIKCRALVS